MTFDNKPGGLDGPPAEAAPKSRLRRAWDGFGFALGIAIVGLAVVFVLTGMAWATAWMITHFPS